MADERKGRERKTKDEEGPFIGASDRPDLTIDLDARIGDLTVRQLSALLAPGVGASGLIWKPIKDAKDTRKDFKDGKDIIDTGSPILKEIFERIPVPWGYPQKPAEAGQGPFGGAGGEWGGASPLDQLIERVAGLERAIERLERQAGREGGRQPDEPRGT